MKPRLVAVLVAAAALLAPATASAAVTAVSPTQGALVTAVQPTFTWALGEGERVDLIRVSRSNKVDAEGLLLQNDSSILNDDASGTSYTVPKTVWSFGKGTYYWQVVGYSADGNEQIVLPPTKFVVPTVLKFIGVRQMVARNAASGDMQAEFVGFTTGNLDTACSIKLTVKRGTKVVYSQVRTQGCASGLKSKIYMNWANGPVRKGTPVTATLSLTGGGRTVTSRVMSFKTP